MLDMSTLVLTLRYVVRPIVIVARDGLSWTCSAFGASEV